MRNSEITNLLTIIDQAFDHTSWHGTNLRGSIKLVKAQDAAWRPASGRHNIWETVVHAAYWKYVVRRRLLSEPKGSFPLKGSNWFKRPAGGAATEAAWKADVVLLVETHRTLREAIEQLPARSLHATPSGSTVSNFSVISGIAAHDLYHAGQIQLLKRLHSTPNRQFKVSKFAGQEGGPCPRFPHTLNHHFQCEHSPMLISQFRVECSGKAGTGSTFLTCKSASADESIQS